MSLLHISLAILLTQVDRLLLAHFDSKSTAFQLYTTLFFVCINILFDSAGRARGFSLGRPVSVIYESVMDNSMSDSLFFDYFRVSRATYEQYVSFRSSFVMIFCIWFSFSFFFVHFVFVFVSCCNPPTLVFFLQDIE